MVKRNSLMFAYILICIIFVGAMYLSKPSSPDTPVTPTVISGSSTATSLPSATPVSTPTASQPTPVKTIEWAGHTWDVTDYTSQVFTTTNVWVDSSGQLHMKLIYENGTWHDFNLIDSEKANYGTYKWTVASNVDYIQDKQDGGNPGFLFSPFLFDNTIQQYNYGEMDIEMCKWGGSNLKSNTDWTVATAGPNVQYNHFTGAGNTWTLEWTPYHIKFSVQGPSQPYKEWVFTDTSKIPPDTGSMESILTIGQFKKSAPPGNLSYYEAEVVLSNYSYTPYNSDQVATQTATPTPTSTSAATTPGTPVSSVQWSGHSWDVTDYTDQVFTTNNVYVDPLGRLHMKLIYDGSWHDFNLIQEDAVGYGTYKWTVASDVSNITDLRDGGDPSFLFSPFLFDNTISQYSYGEMDIQMSKQGDPNLKYNTNWTIWSAGPQVRTNQITGAGNTWTLEWMPDHIKFSVQGPSQPYEEWIFTDDSKIPPSTGAMKSLITIGQLTNAPPLNNASYYEAEVVLSNYSYTPYEKT